MAQSAARSVNGAGAPQPPHCTGRRTALRSASVSDESSSVLGSRLCHASQIVRRRHMLAGLLKAQVCDGPQRRSHGLWHLGPQGSDSQPARNPSEEPVGLRSLAEVFASSGDTNHAIMRHSHVRCRCNSGYSRRLCWQHLERQSSRRNDGRLWRRWWV